MMARTGRPPLATDDPSVTLHVRVPATQFDASYAAARDARQTLAEWVRDALREAGAAPAPRAPRVKHPA
jgi:hypothetical protein